MAFMASKKRPKDEATEWYVNMSENPNKSKRYEQYLKKHEKRLRELERDARGEQVPGDYDGGYDD